MSSKSLKAQLSYLLRTHLYTLCSTECRSELSRRGNDPFVLFVSALSLALAGDYNTALEQFQQVARKRDLEYPALIASKEVHGWMRTVDRHEIDSIHQSLPSAEDNCSEVGYLLLSTFYYHTSQYGLAKTSITRVCSPSGVSMNATQSLAHNLNGWISLALNSDVDEALRMLDDPSMGRDLDALMCKARIFGRQGRGKKKLDQLNEAIALESWFTPALVEKGKSFLNEGEWEQAEEMAQRVLNASSDSSNPLEAHMLITAVNIMSKGRDVVEDIGNLYTGLKEHERGNANIYYEAARLFSRLCGRNKGVLQFTVKMVKDAISTDPNNAKYHCELAYQHRLQGQYGLALDTYRDAAKLDESSSDAMIGSMYCQIMQGGLEDAEQQLEFLSVVQGDSDQNSEVTFMRALLAVRKDRDNEKHLMLLDETVEKKDRENHELICDDVFDEYKNLNPDFMVEIAKEYLQHLHSPANVMTGGSADNIPPAVVAGLGLLKKATSRVPALLDAHLVVAKANFEMKKLDKTMETLSHCLSINPSHSDTYLQLAQLHLAKESFRSANNCLEQAMSYDFKIRNSPIYQLVKSECLVNQGALDDAMTQLEDAMKLPGVRDGLNGTVSLSDRVSIFVKLAEIYSRLNMLSQANEILSEGKAAFEGTAEQIRILVANSDLAIKKNDFTSAINMLSSVSADSSLYTHAVVAKADIYLKHRHDKQAFAQCYLELIQVRKTAATYILLGEAYMRIQAPESAIEAFENALRYNPKDSRLAEKIGKALVSTHDYRKAQDYYDNALRNMPDNTALRYDMARLYTKLRMFNDSAKTLTKALSNFDEDDEDGVNPPGLDVLTKDVETLLLLVETYKESGEKEEMKNTLLRARNIQRMVMERARSAGEGKSTQRTTGSEICYMLAQCAEEEKDDDTAIDYYKEGLENSVHEPSMLSLSKVHLRKHNIQECEDMCRSLLRVASKKEEASMIMGDLMFIKGEYEKATVQYFNLLAKNPNNYIAMEKIVSLLRRSGKLQDAPSLFEKAEVKDPRSSSHAGLYFSKGLYYRYTNNIMDAIKHFNLARRDGEWGSKALANMIDIYTNPDGSNLWEDGEGGLDGTNRESIRVAEKLLRELEELGPRTQAFTCLENFHLLATGQKDNINRAMVSFTDVLENEKDNLPAMLGVSTAYMIEKAPNKARNYLKRIAKLPYNQEFAEEFEKAYLMLADIYIGRGKFDLAQDLCKKCLSFNKSCAGAWELMGVIMEKEQSYKDAAECYEKSWNFEHQASASVGFKLAFNYLKAKRYVEAIDISNKVLAQYPDYPKIRKEILERAMEGLRP